MAALALVICSCAVPIKEENFYTDAGINGAVETHFYDTSISFIGLDAWNSLREGMTCVDSSAFADIKAEIEELCSKTSCSEATNSAISAFFKKIQTATSRASSQPLP